jgi:hypothetical protein
MKSVRTCSRLPEPRDNRGIDPTTIAAIRILRAKDVLP